MNVGRYVAVLGTVCALSGFGLSFFYSVTQPHIERNRAARELRLKRALVPAAVDFKVRTGTVSYRAVEDAVDAAGALVGVLVRDVCRGYGGDMEYLAAFAGSSAAVLGVRVLSHRETPGLGAKVVSPGFLERFVGKSGAALLLARDGGTVDALSGATITSRAIARALARVSSDAGLVPLAVSPATPETSVSTVVVRPLLRRRTGDGTTASTGAAVETPPTARPLDGGGTIAPVRSTGSPGGRIRIVPSGNVDLHPVLRTTTTLHQQPPLEPSTVAVQFPGHSLGAAAEEPLP